MHPRFHRLGEDINVYPPVVARGRLAQQSVIELNGKWFRLSISTAISTDTEQLANPLI